MAEEKTSTATRERSSSSAAAGTVTFDDEAQRDKQRKRNAGLAEPPKFTGDLDDLRVAGVPEQLLDGRDPDARLID